MFDLYVWECHSEVSKTHKLGFRMAYAHVLLKLSFWVLSIANGIDGLAKMPKVIEPVLREHHARSAFNFSWK